MSNYPVAAVATPPKRTHFVRYMVGFGLGTPIVAALGLGLLDNSSTTDPNEVHVAVLTGIWFGFPLGLFLGVVAFLLVNGARGWASAFRRGKVHYKEGYAQGQAAAQARSTWPCCAEPNPDGTYTHGKPGCQFFLPDDVQPQNVTQRDMAGMH